MRRKSRPNRICLALLIYCQLPHGERHGNKVRSVVFISLDIPEKVEYMCACAEINWDNFLITYYTEWQRSVYFSKWKQIYSTIHTSDFINRTDKAYKSRQSFISSFIVFLSVEWWVFPSPSGDLLTAFIISFPPFLFCSSNYNVRTYIDPIIYHYDARQAQRAIVSPLGLISNDGRKKGRRIGLIA